METYNIKTYGLFWLIKKSFFEEYFSEKGEFKNLEFTLNRIKKACQDAGINDDISSNTIHIAGTNGKGSTAYFIDQILRHRGLRTGLFTSPHINRVNERIKVDNKDISDLDFNNLFSSLKETIDNNNLSYFEALTLIAFKHFKDSDPDAAIIETGLGGRLDSTNVLNKKTPVITSISLDHTEYLGDNIFKIADEKLAIIKDNSPVFIGANTEQMNTYIHEQLSEKAIIKSDYSDDEYKNFESPYSNNLKLAELVANSIKTGSYPEKLELPKCRLERLRKFLLDGAHNEDAILNLFSNIKNKPTTIFSSTSDRETEELLKIVEKYSSEVILTEIPDSQRSVDIDKIKTTAIKEKNLRKAIKIAVELSGNADILICGSLYLCGCAREVIKNS